MIAASSPGTPVRSSTGFTAVSHIFVMEWAAVLLDIVIGLLIAGAIGAWVARSSRWAASLSDVSGVLVVQVDDNGVPTAWPARGSIGNVPLAAVLFNEMRGWTSSAKRSTVWWGRTRRSNDGRHGGTDCGREPLMVPANEPSGTTSRSGHPRHLTRLRGCL